MYFSSEPDRECSVPVMLFMLILLCSTSDIKESSAMIEYVDFVDFLDEADEREINL